MTDRPVVLFVDDEPSILSAFQRALMRERYEVATAGSAAEALELIDRLKPAVVVSDVRMEGMSGIELLARLAKRLPRTVRLILTGCSDQQLVDEAIARGGVYRCITKPCKNEDLKAALEDALSKYEQTA